MRHLAHHSNHKDLHKELENLREKYIDRWACSIPNRPNRLIKCSLMAIKFDFDKLLSVADVKLNMTYSERCAHRSFVRNKRIMISKADKGDTTVIMATSQYLYLAYKQLNDKEMYQRLSRDPTQEIVKQFNQPLELIMPEKYDHHQR